MKCISGRIEGYYRVHMSLMEFWAEGPGTEIVCGPSFLHHQKETVQKSQKKIYSSKQSCKIYEAVISVSLGIP